MILPVSTMQAAILDDQAVLPGTHQVAMAWRVVGEVPPARFVAAAEAVMAASPLFRSTFHRGPSGWERHVHPALPAPVQFLGVSEESAARDVLGVLAGAPIDVTAAPPFRLTVARLASDRHAVLLVVHHVAYDAATIGPLAHALGNGFGGAPIPPAGLDHAAFVEAERAWLDGPDRDAALVQARAELGNRPLALPLPVVGSATVQHGVTRRYTGASLARAAASASPLAALLGGWWGVLTEWLGREDLVLGTTVALRPAALRDVVGPAFQYVPLAPDIPRGVAHPRAVRAAHVHLRAAFRRAWLPLGLLGAPRGRVALGLNANLNFYDIDRLPGGDLIARYRRREPVVVNDVTLSELGLPEAPVVRPYDLNLAVFKVNDTLAATLRYRPDLLDAVEATGLVDELAARVGLEAA